MTIVNREHRRQKDVRVLHFIHPPSQQEAKGYQHKHKHEFQFLLGQEESQSQVPGNGGLAVEKFVNHTVAGDLERSASNGDGLQNSSMSAQVVRQPGASPKNENLHASGVGSDRIFTLIHNAKSVWVSFILSV